MGTVGTPPRPVTDQIGGGWLFLLATLDRAGPTPRIERHRVRLLSAEVPPAIGSEVLVEGTLVLEVERRRHVVVGQTAILLNASGAPPSASSQILTHHQSPRPHERAGHWRRLGLGTPRERLVWVNSASVGAKSDRRVRPDVNVQETHSGIEPDTGTERRDTSPR